MKLATLRLDGAETVAVVVDAGVLPLSSINARLKTDWPTDLLSLLAEDRFDAFTSWFAERPTLAQDYRDDVLSGDTIQFAPPYRRPRKIWGIGLNYVAHAADLSEVSPEDEPASFLKPDTTITGAGMEIRLPEQSRRVTAEAELGIIIGKTAVDVSEEDALSVVAGFTPIIDMTAEDILRRNPRYLTRSKSFDTFLSFGPEVATVDELVPARADLPKLEVSTWLNGSMHSANVVGNMTFSPEFLVAFHSRVMTLLPGDIISTGTPGAAVIDDGDTAACRIPGLAELRNPVVRR